jgi:hypothetical protein
MITVPRFQNSGVRLPVFKSAVECGHKSVLSVHGVEAGCEADAAVDMEPTLRDLEAVA